MPALWIVIIAAILIAVGAFLLYNLDRGIGGGDLAKVVVPGIILVGLGLFLMFYNVPVEVIKKKVWGIGLSLFGFWFAFRFPDVQDYQPKEMAWAGFVVGIVCLVIGIWLVFFS